MKKIDYVDFNKITNNEDLLDIGFSVVNASQIEKNDYIFNFAHYADAGVKSNYETVQLKTLLESSKSGKVGSGNPPIMSITMNFGLIDQSEKFKKRIASQNISSYKKVLKNDLVVGFPIDEGVLGFQKIYPEAAVSPAYKVWKIRDGITINIEYLDLILRSDAMRKIYKSKMQSSVERRRNIPDEMFLNISIPNPPLEIQSEIVSTHYEVRELSNKLKKANEFAKEKIGTLWGSH